MTGLNEDKSGNQLSCEACQRVIKTWLDGELEPARAVEVERHTEVCAACRSVAGDFREMAALIRSLGDDAQARLEVPEAARRVASGAIAKAKWARREEVHFVRLLQRVASAAAAVLVVALGLQMFSGLSDGGGTPVSDAAASDSRDGVLELLISDPTWKDDL